jgi:hypothetical protein
LRLVFATIVPGWHGRPLPAAFPRHVRLLLILSLSLVDLVALTRHGRTFRLLPPHRREQLLHDMAQHRSARLRRMVQWWKLIALVTR